MAKYFVLNVNATNLNDPISQGDIFKDVKLYTSIEKIDDNTFQIYEFTFPYVVVITQSCDLQRCNEVVASDNVENGEKHVFGKYLLQIMVLPIFDKDLLSKGINTSNLNNNHIQSFYDIESLDSRHPLRRIKFDDMHNSSNSDVYRIFTFKRKNTNHLYDVNLVDFTQYFGIDYITINGMKGNRIGRFDFDESQKLINMFSAYFSRVSTESEKE